MDLAAGVQVCIFIFLSTLGHEGRNGFRLPSPTIFPLSHLPSILSCSLYLIPTTFSTHPIHQPNSRTIPSLRPAALFDSHRSTSFSRPTLAQPYSPEAPEGRPRRRMIRVPVVVIGAGAAGVAAASRLHEHGFGNVRVLEAQGRSGGRVFSEKYADGSFVEYGAQWIHGEDHEVYRLAKEHDLIFDKRQDSLVDEDEATGELVLDSGRQLTEDEEETAEAALHFLNNVLEELEDCVGDVIPNFEKKSVGTIVKERFDEHLAQLNDKANEPLRKAVLDWFVRYQLVDNGCTDLSQLSVRAFTDYKLVGDVTVRLKVPLSDLLTLFSTFPSAQITLNKAVRKIHFDETNSTLPLSVLCEDGEVVRTRHVIFTGSLGVLKAHPSLFDPPLAAKKRDAIEEAGFGTICKILLQFERPFWEELEPPTDGFQTLWLNRQTESAVVEDSNVPWYRSALGLDAIRTHKNTLVLWLAGPRAAEVDGLSDEQIKQDVVELLRKFAVSSSIPKPVRVMRERWSSNPYIRGTYSYHSMESTISGLLIEDLAEPVWIFEDSKSGSVPALLFAGEATHSNYFSTVHGAILSGWREADRLKELYLQKSY
ncbi:hypothetical protein RvY_03614 [Ramazzottius varieornatus]|uniref:Amine oxidase domain-containing protein n=1 Tax=Ramazzottius varieornatus TaxID=947166 RepID=A0A1D1UY33_RAMVA|nr:hypothetical protein RvY_03614 [Ramazzottius varieornatus]